VEWTEPAPRGRWGLGRAGIALAVASIVLLVVGLLSITVELPYFAISPGTSQSVEPLISVPAAKRHPIKGAVMLTTVYLSRVRPLEYVYAWTNHDVQIVSTQSILGNLPASQLQQVDEAEMTGSKEAAEVVALRRLGYPVTEHGTGAIIDAVVPRTPAARAALAVGDTITAINGKAVNTAADASAVLGRLAPNANAVLSISTVRKTTTTVTVTLTKRPDAPSRGFLGVGLATRGESFDFPFPVSIDSGQIGGPSAGLAFTLGLIDTLTNGNLTGGHRIAATGTIDLTGAVGDVGGVAQKTVSVADAGATDFLVPAGEYKEALAHAGPNLRVYKVNTLADALAVLAKLGGDLSGIPPVPAGQQ